jgi:hypothetical protein
MLTHFLEQLKLKLLTIGSYNKRKDQWLLKEALSQDLDNSAQGG